MAKRFEVLILNFFNFFQIPTNTTDQGLTFKKNILKKFPHMYEVESTRSRVRTYPVSLGNFGLRFFLRHEPPRPPKIFFSVVFFLKSSQDLRLRWQYFCGFLPFFNFAPHEFF